MYGEEGLRTPGAAVHRGCLVEQLVRLLGTRYDMVVERLLRHAYAPVRKPCTRKPPCQLSQRAPLHSPGSWDSHFAIQV
jgi:hypothetical protein